MDRRYGDALDAVMQLGFLGLGVLVVGLLVLAVYLARLLATVRHIQLQVHRLHELLAWTGEITAALLEETRRGRAPQEEDSEAGRDA